MLLMGVPRGSPMNRVTEELVGSVSVGGRDVDMGVTSIRVCGFAVGGVGELAIKTGDTDRPMFNRVASRKDVGEGGTNMDTPREVRSEGGRKADAFQLLVITGVCFVPPSKSAVGCTFLAASSAIAAGCSGFCCARTAKQSRKNRAAIAKGNRQEHSGAQLEPHKCLVSCSADHRN